MTAGHHDIDRGGWIHEFDHSGSVQACFKRHGVEVTELFSHTRYASPRAAAKKWIAERQIEYPSRFRAPLCDAPVDLSDPDDLPKGVQSRTRFRATGSIEQSYSAHAFPYAADPRKRVVLTYTVRQADSGSPAAAHQARLHAIHARARFILAHCAQTDMDHPVTAGWRDWYLTNAAVETIQHQAWAAYLDRYPIPEAV